jgi:hypothetical protein
MLLLRARVVVLACRNPLALPSFKQLVHVLVEVRHGSYSGFSGISPRYDPSGSISSKVAVSDSLPVRPAPPLSLSLHFEM